MGRVSIPFDTNWHSFLVDDSITSIDDSSSAGNFTINDVTNKNILIFGFLGTTNAFAFSNYLRISKFKIFIDDILVRDLIPVRKGNIGYMYDRVSGQLFGNQGTGEFVLGPDIINYIADDYIQDGLVAMWDGIENAGWGTHDPSATTWKNLIEDGIDFSFSNAEMLDDCLYLKLGGIAECPSSQNVRNALSTKQITVEMVIKTISSPSYALHFAFGSNDQEVEPRRLFWLLSGPNKQFHAQDAYSSNGSTGEFGINVSNFNKLTHIRSEMSSSMQRCVIDEDSVFSGNVGSRYASNINGRVFLGKSEWGDIEQEYYSIRIYNRLLSNVEASNNYEIDKARFGL